MGNLISTIGLILASYTLVAMMTGLPQLSDLFPVGLFQDSSEKYDKIVSSNEPSNMDYYVIGFGLLLVVIGFMVNKDKNPK